MKILITALILFASLFSAYAAPCGPDYIVVPGYINGIPAEEFFETFKSEPINYKVFSKAFNEAGGKVYEALKLLDPSLYQEVTLTVQGEDFKALVWWFESHDGKLLYMITRYGPV